MLVYFGLYFGLPISCHILSKIQKEGINRKYRFKIKGTLGLTIQQMKLLNSLMKTTNRKDEYGVSSRSVQRWIAIYLDKGIDGLRTKKPGGTKFRITEKKG